MTDQSIHQDEEIWKPVVGYEGYYEVSNLGRFRSIERLVNGKPGWKNRIPARYIKPQKTVHGYIHVKLSKDGKSRRMIAHRLVISAFYGQSTLPVDHLNGNRSDNRLKNLEYVSHRENVRRGKLCYSGSPGVFWGKREGKWICALQHNNKRYYGGSFLDKEDAYKARDGLLKKLGILWDGEKFINPE